MRKIIIAFVVSFVALVLVFPAFAVDRPKGLKDRGPLTKKTFIHYKKGFAKPPWAGGGKPKGDDKCYAFLAKGAKWKTEIGEPFSINPNDSGLSAGFVQTAIDNSVSEWESYGLNIFGSSSLDNSIVYDGDNWDNLNTVSFGSYHDSNVIAVTTIWGYFSGPPRSRELVEWDMLFNTYWDWNDASVSTTPVMDLENIASHELGHSAGMSHPGDTCGEETMYAFSTLDEIKKRDLHTGDITGIVELYR